MKDNKIGTIGVLKYLMIIMLLSDILSAMIRFLPNDQLVKESHYIVIAKVIGKHNTSKIKVFGSSKAQVLENCLIVLESIKGDMQQDDTFAIDTLKYDDWMEDNVELPSKGKKVLLFLEKDKDDKLRPVYGSIQGVWTFIKDGILRYGTLKEIREIVQQQKNQSVTKKRCNSKAFVDLLDTAEVQTQAGRYKEALESYRKAYRICPMKDLEEMMAWLMGKVGVDKNKNIDGGL